MPGQNHSDNEQGQEVELYQKILANLHEGYILSDEKGIIREVNSAYSKLVGYSKAELSGKHIREVEVKFNDEEIREVISEVNKKGYLRFETIHQTKSNEHVYFDVSMCAIRVNGEWHRVAFLRNITQQKKDREKLEETRQQFKSLFENNPHAVYYMDLEGNFLGINSKMEELTGYSRDEILSLNFAPLITDKDLEITQKHFEKAANGYVQAYEIEGITKQGKAKPVRITNFPMIVGDEIVGVFGIAEDLTEKRKSEQKRRESEQRFRSLFKHNPHPVYRFGLKGNFQEVNDKMVEFTGYSRKELLQTPFGQFVDEDDLEQTKQHFKEAKSGIPSTHEMTVWVKGDLKKEVRSIKFPMYVDGEIAGVYGIIQDITEQKRTAQKLKESEKRWEHLVETSPLPIQVIKNGEILYINKAGADLYGCKTSDELIGESIYEFNTTPNKERIQKRVAEMNAGHSVGSHEHSIINKKGEERFVEVHSVGITYQGKKAVQSIYRDITEQKIAEEKLKESEERWHRLVEENPKPVQITIDGNIVFINEAGVDLYEAETREVLIGKSVLDFCHPDDLAELKERKHKLENQLRVDQIHENRIITLAGNEKNIEVHSIPITYKGENAIQTVIYDITERKHKENLIQSSLEEKKIMLQEIHHRVKNNMAVVSGLLELQAMNTEDKVLQNTLKESQMRIYSMAMIHEKLYASKSLAEISFDEYAQELVKAIISSLNDIHPEVEVRYRMDSGRLNINQAIPCALILNELVVNCFKHAFIDQDAGTILIGLARKDGKVIISVEDNGVGLPDDLKIKNQQTLGMTIVQTLVRQLNGELIINTGNNRAGACFIIIFTEHDS